jgi:hypothetical protein
MLMKELFYINTEFLAIFNIAPFTTGTIVNINSRIIIPIQKHM